MHGDLVQVEIQRHRHDHQQPQGAIVKILEHANKFILGRLARTGRYAVVTPKNPKINRLVEIHRRITPEEVPDGAWVMVEIRQWSDSPFEPLAGRLTEVLGVDEDKGISILLLIRQKGIVPEFPPEVEAAAAAIKKQHYAHHGKAEYKGRRDFRGERVFTVDPKTAKDFDDAISLLEARSNHWRIGVHIADVAHFIQPASPIDMEAFDRATSIYPVDRVIPMLPEALSNDLCSLRPNEDRLTMSAIFTVNRSGEISDVELCNSVIHSVRRFYYEEVQGLFNEADVAEGLEIDAQEMPHPRPVIDTHLHSDLMAIRKASLALRAARMARGALNLELPETEILFDAEGKVADLRRRDHFEAHELIEELMIAANEAVARQLELHHIPVLFRVHDKPNEGKVRVIAPVLARFNIPIPSGGILTREQLQQALNAAREHEAGAIVQRWVLRAMMRARYQPENIGHYGLASESYLHFTSPIRRYPDLVVHRVMKALLEGKRAGDPYFTDLAANLPLWGRHTSGREERAQRVEWDAQEILGLEFMRRYLGDIFDGFISGVNNMGFFVELKDYPVEGLVRVSQLDDDYYELDSEYQVWRGQRSGRVFGLGEPVTVMIERIDVLAGQMDLLLIRKKKTGGKQKHTKSRKIFARKRRR